jgi:hypothetical protein
MISTHHEWFSSVNKYVERQALGRSVLHVGAPQVQPFLNAGGHAPHDWETPSDWVFELLTKQLMIPGRRFNRQQLAKLDFPAPSS